MIALQISSTKQFMSELLIKDSFDIFLLEEASVGAANTVSIDGHINKDFYEAEEREALPEFRPWPEIKSLCFDLIKGKRTPLFFRFVLHLNEADKLSLLTKEGCEVDPALVKTLAVNIRYDGTKAVLTTGTAFHSFVLSKSADEIWDKAVQRFLEKYSIGYEIL